MWTVLTSLIYVVILFFSMIAADHPIMMGFEPLVNQRLLPPTFPRYAKIIKREDMVAYFSKLIERIKTVCDVINTTNLHGILVNTFPALALLPDCGPAWTSLDQPGQPGI